ncbi:unnamed protein product, partial [Ilex paraguariensis]
MTGWCRYVRRASLSRINSVAMNVVVMGADFGDDVHMQKRELAEGAGLSSNEQLLLGTPSAPPDTTQDSD